MKLFPLRYLSIVAIIVQLNFKDSESSGDIKLRQSCDLLRSRLFSLETVAQYLSRYILMMATIMARARVVAMSMSRSMAMIFTSFQLASCSEGQGTVRHLIQ